MEWKSKKGYVRRKKPAGMSTMWKKWQKKEVMHVLEYEYEAETKEEKTNTVWFQWISSLEVTERNIEELIVAGRGRWKMEDEGFNNQETWSLLNRES